jgi:hypothetical protein
MDNILEKFSHFIDKGVSVSAVALERINEGITEIQKTYSIAKDDPIIADIKSFAKETGFTITRVLLPNDRRSMDARPDRLNVYVVEDTDNNFKVGKLTKG